MNYNYNQNNNEYLFWKVFHNKFLFNLIIQHIHNTEWVLYDDHDQIHIDNRSKFKDTHSLELMIKNKLYTLLNYKLDNNQYIQIDRVSISTLFNQLSSINNNKNNKNSNDTNSILKEILIKILEKRRNEFEIKDLTKIAVKCNSIDGLRILTNESYSIPIYPSTLKYAIKHSHPIIVDEILKINSNNYLDRNNNEAFNEIKKESLNQASKNIKYQSEMKEFVLFNLKLPTTTDIDKDETEEIKKLKFEILFKNLLSSFKNIKFVDLSYYEILSIYQVLYGIPFNDNNHTKLPLKELQQIILIQFKNKYYQLFKNEYLEFYKSYIIKYREIINECHDNEDDQEYNTEKEMNISVDQQKNDLIKFKDLLKISHIELDKQVIIKDCCNGTLVWNEILFEILLVEEDQEKRVLEPLIINDKSIIEWILNCKNQSIIYFLYTHFNRITFGTLELAEYVYKESGLINHLGINNSPGLYKFIFYQVWNEAIKQSNLNTIKHLEALNLIEIINYSSISTINQTLKFINYLNETDFNNFNKNSYDLLFKHIINVYKDNSSEFSNIKLKFKDFQSIISILIEAMIDMNLKMVELILNSNIFDQCFNNVEFYNHFNQLPKDVYGDYFYIKHGRETNEIKKTTITTVQIIKIIDKIIKRIKPTSSVIEIQNPISVMVNYYFNIFIQIKGITMDEVKKVYELITEHSIIIEHDLYHSFYYLHIKNIIYTKYITNIYSRYINQEWFDLKEYINPSIFTFQIINNHSFETIIQMLFDRLSPFLFDNSKFNNPKIFYDHLNSELDIYLTNRRVDLFFKKLKYIKNLVDTENEKDQNNINYQSNLFSKTVILFKSPSTTLLSTSTLFNQVDDITPPNIPLKFIENFKQYEFQPIEPLAYTFKFSHFLKEAICKVLELDEIIKVIKFNYYQPAFHFSLFYYAHFTTLRFDITKFIYDNFKVPLSHSRGEFYCNFESLSFNLNNYFQFFENPCKFLKYEIQERNEIIKLKFLQLLTNQFKKQQFQNNFQKFIKPSTSFQDKIKILNATYKIIHFEINRDFQMEDLLSIRCNKDEYLNDFISKQLIELYHKDEYQSLFNRFFNIILQNQEQLQNPHLSSIAYNEVRNNIFLNSFKCKFGGGIKVCELILSHYQQTYNFKITNQSITEAIENNSIHIIIYFLKNHKNMWSTDSIDHLKSELKNHKNYKYLNILE